LGRLRLLEEDPESLLDFPALLRKIDASIRCAGRRRPAVFGTPVGHPGGFAWLGLRKTKQPGYPASVAVPAMRIRFTTSHPFDANERLFAAMAECESVCEWLHLPVQSGSNRILRAMRRGYTAEAYLKKTERLRSLIPDISLTTDMIVGFPGEKEEDFAATVRLMREVQYDYAYIFKYSPRPGTDAAAQQDDVPPEVKAERNQRLLALQEEISRAKHQGLVGRRAEILIEDRGRFARQWFGRTRGNHGVIVPARPMEHAAGRPADPPERRAGKECPEDLLGQMVEVDITRASAHSLFGERACHGLLRS
jgi:tRNA A37 methylthiotransferase MiaB